MRGDGFRKIKIRKLFFGKRDNFIRGDLAKDFCGVSGGKRRRPGCFFEKNDARTGEKLVKTGVRKIAHVGDEFCARV